MECKHGFPSEYFKPLPFSRPLFILRFCRMKNCNSMRKSHFILHHCWTGAEISFRKRKFIPLFLFFRFRSSRSEEEKVFSGWTADDSSRHVYMNVITVKTRGTFSIKRNFIKIDNWMKYQFQKSIESTSPFPFFFFFFSFLFLVNCSEFELSLETWDTFAYVEFSSTRY